MKKYMCIRISMVECNHHLTRASWMVAVKAWPRCSWPVTFGGGKMMENTLPGFPRDGEKWPCSFHQLYHLASTEAES